MSSVDLLIVGAGPAGMAAAVAARRSGLDVVVVDDQPAPGGQIWRSVETVAAAPRGAILGESYQSGLPFAEAFRASGARLRAGRTALADRAGLPCLRQPRPQGEDHRREGGTAGDGRAGAAGSVSRLDLAGRPHRRRRANSAEELRPDSGQAGVGRRQRAAAAALSDAIAPRRREDRRLSRHHAAGPHARRAAAFAQGAARGGRPSERPRLDGDAEEERNSRRSSTSPTSRRSAPSRSKPSATAPPRGASRRCLQISFWCTKASCRASMRSWP